MKARFPALIHYALPPRHVHPRPSVVAPEVDVDLVELTDGEDFRAFDVSFPVMGGQTVDRSYRYYDGRLFTENSHSVQWLLDGIANPLMKHGPFSVVLDEIADEIDILDRQFKPWPDDIRGHLKRYSGNHGAAEKVLAKSHLVTGYRGEEFDSHLERWRYRWLQELGNHVIMDGKLWTRAPEPAIVVSVGSAGVHISCDLSNFCDDIPGKKPERRRVNRYNFPIDQMEAALAFSETLPGGRNGVQSEGEISISIHDHSSVSDRLYAYDILSAAWHMSHFIEPGRVGGELERKRLLLWVQHNAPEMASRTMEEILPRCGSLGPATSDGIPAAVLMANFERHIGKWDNRPEFGLDAISFGPAAPTP